MQVVDAAIDVNVSNCVIDLFLEKGMKKAEKEYALVFKALADATRLEIVDMISCGELCACEILKSFQFTQSTLSYHMKLLTDSGLVNVRRDGKRMMYSIDDEKAISLKLFWENFMKKSKKDEASRFSCADVTGRPIE